jgi:hypothetical protein
MRRTLARAAWAAARGCGTRCGRRRLLPGFRLCAHELTVLRPSNFPKATEFVPEPTHDVGAIAPIALLTRLNQPGYERD